ncbi:MAG: SMI1/KNR4 family protein [Chloroflexi bacterium]|nr:SMI1/KNR4 family protein [Chloroflexota bacterium]
MWKDLISKLTANRKYSASASPEAISVAENLLNLKFPETLKSLLSEADGIEGEYSLDLIWSLSKIQEANIEFRTYKDFKELYMPFDSLLFFADAGNGNQFAFSILSGEIRKDDIFCWNHEDDSRTWVAPSLERYLEWRLSGRLKLS